MEIRPRYSFARRILFPYSGEVPLTLAQGLRVIITWALFFSLGMSLCTLLITVLTSSSLYSTLMLLLFTFASGVGIFGGLAVLVVVMSNQAARIIQARRATKPDGHPGGRYGS